MGDTEDNKLHVGGLNYDSTSEDLKSLFSKYGDVEDGKSWLMLLRPQGARDKVY